MFLLHGAANHEVYTLSLHDALPICRNGTVLDDERLQAGQRHALRTGQVIGLGESGPRLRVTTLESRAASETLMEVPEKGAAKTTAPRQRPAVGGLSGAVAAQENTAAMRK